MPVVRVEKCMCIGAGQGRRLWKWFSPVSTVVARGEGACEAARDRGGCVGNAAVFEGNRVVSVNGGVDGGVSLRACDL